ncbi:hypothetical protein [Candidatus Halobonum tyrrellensis]|uniref:Uncharacterized protein n=1 Tax=Candidatus Halobonum tyrrellensis G22 TaxID=1324957 RepID=V4HEF3_9EURY|nr:hypothetical protein [Candidatus Halobonum tyrrellensis]ESP88458.1 hypothetical protein K933_08362 [Candidatus Halobonum tyrrellensis G22]
MSAAVRTLLDAHDPDPRAAGAVLLGSSFALFAFLTSPDVGNPYYLFGVAVMAFAVLWAVAVLVADRRT